MSSVSAVANTSNASTPTVAQDPEEIIDTYKQMSSECSAIMNKSTELQVERDEHRLVIDTLSKLESERKAFRLVSIQI